ncbi:hypothetical protein V1291_002075 [Nitrobacteraceae bacterium AZCC 1564]
MRDFVRSPIAMLAVAAFALFSPALNSVMAQTPKQSPAPAAKQPPAAQQAAPAPASLKQIELNEKQVESLLAAQKEMDAVSDKLPAGASDNPDPKLQAQFDAIAKKNGFASFDEYGTVYDNVSLVMSGIDPKTKAFTEPPEALKKQIAAVQAEAKIPAKDKKAILDDMNEALKTIEPVKYPGNVTLVTKYYDKLGALMQDDE